jgi:hypothetical protein
MIYKKLQDYYLILLGVLVLTFNVIIHTTLFPFPYTQYEVDFTNNITLLFALSYTYFKICDFYNIVIHKQNYNLLKIHDLNKRLIPITLDVYRKLEKYKVDVVDMVDSARLIVKLENEYIYDFIINENYISMEYSKGYSYDYESIKHYDIISLREIDDILK